LRPWHTSDPGKLYIKINWRVSRPNGQFYERSDIQTFATDPNSSAVLHNDGRAHFQHFTCASLGK
jgi:violaxanthin de-epoxidase